MIKEVLSDFRPQEIHICFVIGLHRRNISPICIYFISINPLDIFIADKDIFDQIIPVFFSAAFQQFNQLASSENIDSGRDKAGTCRHRLLFKLLNPVVFVHLQYAKSGRIIIFAFCADDSDVGSLSDMILEYLVIVKLIYTIS